MKVEISVWRDGEESKHRIAYSLGDQIKLGEVRWDETGGR